MNFDLLHPCHEKLGVFNILNLDHDVIILSQEDRRIDKVIPMWLFALLVP